VGCQCDDHPGKELINKRYSLSVDYMKELLFTQNSMMSAFWKYRKLENVRLSEWVDGKQHLDYSMNLGAFGTAKNYEDLVDK
jgi:hypothetical protein